MKNCISDKINATDAEIAARFCDLGCRLAIGYGDEDSIIVTEDTLDDFRAARKLWREPGKIEIEQTDALVIQDAQAAKGQPRGCVVVVDFGQARAVYRA